MQDRRRIRSVRRAAPCCLLDEDLTGMEQAVLVTACRYLETELPQPVRELIEYHRRPSPTDDR
jgi:hypothetical protein